MYRELLQISEEPDHIRQLARMIDWCQRHPEEAMRLAQRADEMRFN